MNIDDDKIDWREDTEVDFSRKRRVRTDHGISSRYTKFSPEDQAIDTNGNEIFNEIFPSVNKHNRIVSDYFASDLNAYNHKLNRGRGNRAEPSAITQFIDKDPLWMEDDDEC